jgi:predicted secreted protein
MSSTLAKISPSVSNQLNAITDAQKPIVLHQPNKTFQISLKSNPTTGYIWVLDQFDEQSIKPIQHIYHAPELNNSQGKTVVGAPGQEVWSFTLNKSAMRVPRLMKITFCMMRPWTINCDIKKTFTVIYIHD